MPRGLVLQAPDCSEPLAPIPRPTRSRGLPGRRSHPPCKGISLCNTRVPRGDSSGLWVGGICLQEQGAAWWWHGVFGWGRVGSGCVPSTPVPPTQARRRRCDRGQRRRSESLSALSQTAALQGGAALSRTRRGPPWPRAPRPHGTVTRPDSSGACSLRPRFRVLVERGCRTAFARSRVVSVQPTQGSPLEGCSPFCVG